MIRNTLSEGRPWEVALYGKGGIEVRLPGMGYVDLIPKTHMGISGALLLIEQVLNGCMSRI